VKFLRLNSKASLHIRFLFRRTATALRLEAQQCKARGATIAVKSARSQLSTLKRELAQQQNAVAAGSKHSETALEERNTAQLQQQKESGWKPSVGETVLVPRLNSNAKVIGVGSDGMLTLQAGLLKITARLDEVRRR
jgi:hypothetical protein